MKKDKLHISLFLSSLILTAIVFAPQVKASDELVAVSGNGAESSNTVNTNTSSSTSVSQTNNANVSNNVTTTENTGNNNTSSNTGSASTTTGDANSSTSISNTANSNTAAQCGCESGTNVVAVTGNGADSTNTVNVNNNNSTSVNQTNNASINNSVYTNANTGNNSANNNVGDVSISTGDITSQVDVENKPINISVAKFGENEEGPYSVNISDNGAFSKNKVNVNNNNSIEIDQTNNASIFNLIKSVLNTGNNTANGNVGDVKIETGNILSMVGIENAVNFNKVTINCEEKRKRERERKSSTRSTRRAERSTATDKRAYTSCSDISRRRSCSCTVIRTCTAGSGSSRQLASGDRRQLDSVSYIRKHNHVINGSLFKTTFR